MASKNTLNLIMTSIVLGVGLASGQPIITTLLGGIGVNWASEIVWSAWQQVRDQWFGAEGKLRDDVAQALDRALASTMSPLRLDDEFKATEGYKALTRTEARAVLKTLDRLERTLTNPFSTGKLDSGTLNMLGMPYATIGMLQTQLNEYIRAYLRENKAPEILIHFVQERLNLDSLVGHFVEELKQDTQLWRSQQILFAQGYLSSLSRLEQGQSTILERLDTFIAASKSRNRETNYSPLPGFSNEALLQQAVAKLLTFIPGITDVRILQRGSEQGKDVVFVGNGPLGDRVNCVCVVKNTAITGK